MIYLDNNSTTMVDDRVKKAMIDAFDTFGNPSSTHHLGREARHLILDARTKIATLLNVEPDEIIFNSCATEGLNTLIFGIDAGHIITSDLEHPAVLQAVKRSQNDVTVLSPGGKGAVSAEDVQAAIRDDTGLIVLMSVNNETGVKTDIEAIAKVAQEANIPFVVDGVAHFGKEELIIPDGVSAICFSGHKFHAPKGIGFSFLRKSLKYNPLILGGSQEYNKRAGTENILGIVGLAKAVEIIEMPNEMEKLRNYLESEILKIYPSAEINGGPNRICNTSNIAFSGLDAEILLMKLDQLGLAVGHGSACSSGTLEPSRVLLNMGYSEERAKSSLRFSLSRFTTKDDIDKSLEIIKRAIDV